MDLPLQGQVQDCRRQTIGSQQAGYNNIRIQNYADHNACAGAVSGAMHIRRPNEHAWPCESRVRFLLKRFYPDLWL